METRLVIAYTLIGLLVLAAAAFLFMLLRRQRAHRRRMQGRSDYSRR